MLLQNLNTEIGTAKDNRISPIHDWYRFTAGFSYKLVDKIIEEENLGINDVIYECFAGCGTTLVSAQKKGIHAVGNEAQELLYDVIRAKLNWDIDVATVIDILRYLKHAIKVPNPTSPFHTLLKGLYSESDLKELYFIKDFLNHNCDNEDIILFLKLALTQTLHKVCIHPIAVPYISRSKMLVNTVGAFETFYRTSLKMLYDIEEAITKNRTTEIYLQDSRKKNENICDNECTICITSPPYLNNLDYGEVSKVCSHFFGITNTWNDVTEKVRKSLVTASTTHYKESEWDLENWKTKDFYRENSKLVDSLIKTSIAIKREGTLKKGKKSFDLLTLHYFEDMFKVILEARRVLKEGSKAYLVLGDSAPYGVYIDTISILGEISRNCGFNKYNVVKIRDRGTKWTSLRFRHNLKLSESILILE